MMVGATVIDFSAKSMRDPVTGCWNWAGCVQANGYGRVRLNGRTQYAHRASYQQAHGVVPAGQDICHQCDNRRCVNPAHLFAGSRLENMRDAVAKGRQAKGAALPHTKVDPGAEQRIVEMAKAGVPYKEIGSIFGICRQHAGFVAIQHGVRRNGISQ